MKVGNSYIIFVAAVLLSLASCRKETSVENRAGLGGSFMAKIDGVQWIAADSAKGASILQGLINISGISVDHKQMSITLNDTVPGVYTLNQASVSLAAYAENDSANLYAFASNQGQDTSQAGGLVTVTEIDMVNKTISGTFYFKVYREIDSRQKTITDGIFYKLPYMSSLPPSSSKDTMFATIDANPWVGQSVVASPVSGNIAIIGSNLDGSQSVSLLIPDYVVAGVSYSLAFSPTTSITYPIGAYNPVVGVSLVSSSGSLDIIENNPATRRIRGHFEFLAVDPGVNNSSNPSHRLTSGYFSIQY